VTTRRGLEPERDCVRRERQSPDRFVPCRIAVVSETFQWIVRLIRTGDVRVSNHGYDELAAEGLLARDAVASIGGATVVEDYPDYPKGPCVLVLQEDRHGQPIHVVWGIPRGNSSPAVLVTAYRPDPRRWEADFRRRKR